MVKQTKHWTAASAEAFVRRITFDFIAQLEKKMDSGSMSQAELAQKLGVSEGAVSQVLNNSKNLTLKTIVSYARALGMKVALVGYDDGDPQNERGPVGSEIFSTCWQSAGKPYDLWSLQPQPSTATTARPSTTYLVKVIVPMIPMFTTTLTRSSDWKRLYARDFPSLHDVSRALNRAVRTANNPSAGDTSLTPADIENPVTTLSSLGGI